MECPECGSRNFTEYFNVEARTHFYANGDADGPTVDMDNQMDRHYECRDCEHQWEEDF